MTPFLALMVYALVIGTVGTQRLLRATWPERAPRLGIVAWQVLTGSLLVAVVLAGLSLVVPLWAVSVNLAGFLQTCETLLRKQYSTPGGAAVSTAGLLLALVVALRTVHCLARTLMAARLGRRRQRDQLVLVGRRDQSTGALVVDHPGCAAYCLPGRRGEIVLTSGTVQSLDREELAAVLAHERAHLRGRHDVAAAAAEALQAAFPFVPAFAYAKVELSRLIEMVADDAATRSSDRLTLATALVRLAEGAAPAGTLGAGGDSAVVRVRRLTTPAAPLGLVRSALAVASAVAVMVIPLILAAAPALAVASSSYCPVGFPA